MKSILTLTCILAAASLAEASENIPPAGFTALFNGQDLSGWYGWGTKDPSTLWKMSPAELADYKRKSVEGGLPVGKAGPEHIKAHWRVGARQITRSCQRRSRSWRFTTRHSDMRRQLRGCATTDSGGRDCAGGGKRWGRTKCADAESLTIQIHALLSVGTSSTVHFGNHGIPATTVICAKVTRSQSHRIRHKTTLNDLRDVHSLVIR